MLQAVIAAPQLAAAGGHQAVEPEHLAKALLEQARLLLRNSYPAGRKSRHADLRSISCKKARINRYRTLQ